MMVSKLSWVDQLSTKLLIREWHQQLHCFCLADYFLMESGKGDTPNKLTEWHISVEDLNQVVRVFEIWY